MGVMASPLRGAAGNVEFFAHARAGGEAAAMGEIEAMADAAIAEAPGGD